MNRDIVDIVINLHKTELSETTRKTIYQLMYTMCKLKQYKR